jgi:uncharacterized protein with PCYCGC motif
VRRAPIVAGALLAVAVVGAGAWWWTRASAAGGVTIDEIGDQVQTVPRGSTPVFAKGADTRALYAFATERGDVMKWMPCTCGCAEAGHASNRSCYIKQETAERVTYTSHAAT